MLLFCRSGAGVPRVPVGRHPAAHLAALELPLLHHALLRRTRQPGTEPGNQDSGKQHMRILL